ncbi:MAG: class I SAM-dependent methyltransferase [Bacillaceae bacterium]|nr:class I SAM-dependent methyltransferase [Bacillaceae bacterium]
MGLWYEDHFQEDYLMIYKHRNEKRAQEELTSISKFLPFKKGDQLLDLCCGNGRHCRWFAKQGIKVTGVDLSSTLLKEARKKEQANKLGIRYIQTDMRNIQFDQEFDIVVNLFTSFGYFEQDSENERVIAKISLALKPGGHFLLDFFNPYYVRRKLIPITVETVGEKTIHQFRKIEDNTVKKTIKINDHQGSKRYEERVKLYTEEYLTKIIENYDLRIKSIYGNYDGSPYSVENSERLILLCKKL